MNTLKNKEGVRLRWCRDCLELRPTNYKKSKYCTECRAKRMQIGIQNSVKAIRAKAQQGILRTVV